MGQRFEDLEVWKAGYGLCTDVYRALAVCKDFTFKDQITKAALSIPSNIAEGFERNTNKEFIHFLYIAKGSCGELRTQLYVATDIGYLEKECALNLIKSAESISYMLSALIQKRKAF